MKWKPRKSFRFRWQSQADGVILFDPEENKAFRLNEVAGLIWRLCDGTLDPEMITAKVVQTYPDVTAETARQDVEAFLAQLKAEEMIV